ncbi:MAG: hypothetical protein IPP83_09520 [Flavobacteriales bacterium]|nr:hypothetical protein [Flavobacteriales bacterium]
MTTRLHPLVFLLALFVGGVLRAQPIITGFPWSATFDTIQPFTLVNGMQPNYWVAGNAAGNGSPSLYIGNNFTIGNEYWIGIDPWTGPSALTRVYAYVDLAIPVYHYAIDLSFDVRVGGESNDNLKVMIIPADVTPVAGYNPSSLGPGVLDVSPSLYDILQWQTMHYVLPPSLAGRTVRLVFHWRNDWSGGAQPGAAIDNIMVTTSPCIAPFAVAISGITTNSAVIEWPSIPSAEAFHYELRTSGAVGSGALGLAMEGMVDTEQILLQDLAPGTFYSLFLRTDCTDSLTAWTVAITFVTDPACGSSFFDPGGPTGSYGALIDRTYVICPSGTAEATQVVFSSISFGMGDRLEVYDGAVASGTPKAIITAGAPGLAFVSDHSDGCLTFRFVSDGQWHGAGWQANVSCATRSGCTVWGVDVEPVGAGSVHVGWHCTGAVMPFAVEHGPLGWTPGTYLWPGAGGTVNLADTAAIMLNGLQPGAVYELEIRANCVANGEYDHRSLLTRFQLPPECGQPFTDFGGSLESYPAYESRVQSICPDAPGHAVILTFTSFATEPWYDAFYVFDGPDTSSPLIASGDPAPLTMPNLGPGGWWGLTDIPGPFVSTHSSGCLTTAFISDHMVQFDGWVAQVDCGFVGLPGPAGTDQVIRCQPNPATAGEQVIVRLPDGVTLIRMAEVLGACGDVAVTVLLKDQGADRCALQLPLLPPAMYVLRLVDDRGRSVHVRIMVQ